jgi:hypothetical protein
MFMQYQTEELKEKEDYRKGYKNAIMEFQKQYNLINKKTTTNPPRDPKVDIPSSSNQEKAREKKDTPDKGKQKEDPPRNVPKVRREAIIKEVENVQLPFNFESEIEKIKIYVPFNELIKNVEYKNQIIKMLRMEETSDTLNVQDDHPILFVLGCKKVVMMMMYLPSISA